MVGKASKGKPFGGGNLDTFNQGSNSASGYLSQDGPKKNLDKKKVSNAQETNNTILLGMYTSGGRNSASDPSPSSSDLSEMIRSGDLQTKTSALESLIRHHVNGDAQNHMIMHVIKYLTPVSDHYIKKLVLYFWEVVDKTDEDGNLLSEIILICSFLRNDLEHPNEYIRGLTLRFLAKVHEKELVEPLVSAVVQNVSHRVPYVRRNAALAVHAIYKRFPELLPDVVDVIKGALYVEADISARRHLFDALVDAAPEQAAAFLGEYCSSHDIANAGSAFLQSVMEFARQRISLSVSEKAQYVPVLFAILQSSSFVVRYDCASTLRRLSTSPSAITQAAHTYIDILRQYSDNTVRLIILSQLHQMKERFAEVLRSSSLLDVLSILHEEMGGLTEIRESVWDLATHLISAATVGNFVSAIRKELRRVRDEIGDALNQLLLRKTGGGRGGGSASNTFGTSIAGGLPSGSGGESGGASTSSSAEASSPALVALEEYRMKLLKALDAAAQRFPKEVGELIMAWLPEFHLHHPALVRCNGAYEGGVGKGGNPMSTNLAAEDSHLTSQKHQYSGTGSSRTGGTGGGGGEMEYAPSEYGDGEDGAKEDGGVGSNPAVWSGGGGRASSHPFGRLATLSESGNVEMMVVFKRILLAQERAFRRPPGRARGGRRWRTTTTATRLTGGDGMGGAVAAPAATTMGGASASTAGALARLRQIFPQIGQSNVLRAALWLFGAFSSPDPSPAAANPHFFGLGGGAAFPIFASPEEEEAEWKAERGVNGNDGRGKEAVVLHGAAAVLAMLRQELGILPLTVPKKTMHACVEEMLQSSGGGAGGGSGSFVGAAGGMHAVTTVLEDGTYGITYVPNVAPPSYEDDGGKKGGGNGPSSSGMMMMRVGGGSGELAGGNPGDSTDGGGMLGESSGSGGMGIGGVGEGGSSTTGGLEAELHHSHPFDSSRTFLRSMVVEGDGFLVSALASTIVRLVHLQEASGNPAAGVVAREAGLVMLQEILRYGETAVQQEPYSAASFVHFRPLGGADTGREGGAKERSGTPGRSGGMLLFEEDTEEQLRVSISLLSLPSAWPPKATRNSHEEEEDPGSALALSGAHPLVRETLQTSLEFLTPTPPLSLLGRRSFPLGQPARVVEEWEEPHYSGVGSEEEEEDEGKRGEKGTAGTTRHRGPPRLLDALVSPSSAGSPHHKEIGVGLPFALNPGLLAMWRRSMNTPLFFSSLVTTGPGEEEEEGEAFGVEEGILKDEDGMEGGGVKGAGYGKDADRPALTSSALASSWKHGGGPSAAGVVGSSCYSAPPLPGFVEASLAYLRHLERVVPLSGTNDPIYCECSVHLQEFHLTVHWRLLNCTSSFLQHIVIDLISLGGIKLCERPQVTSLKPFEQLTMTSSLKVDGTETGIIFGYLLFDYPDGNSACVVLNNIEVDILNYVHPVTEMPQNEFRRKWQISEWENRIGISTTIAAVQAAYRKRLGGGGGTLLIDASGNDRRLKEGGEGQEEEREESEEAERFPPSAAAASLEMYIDLVAQTLNVGRIATEAEGEEDRMAQILGIMEPFSLYRNRCGASGVGEKDGEMVKCSSEEVNRTGMEEGGDPRGNEENPSKKVEEETAARGSLWGSASNVSVGSCASCTLAARTTFGEDVLVHISVECDNTGPSAAVNGGTISGFVRIRSTTHTVAYGVGKKLNGLHSQLSLLQGQES